MDQAIIAALIILATLGFVYEMLRRSNMDVPDNAEQFNPDATDWRDTVKQTVIYIQPRDGKPI